MKGNYLRNMFFAVVVVSALLSVSCGNKPHELVGVWTRTVDTARENLEFKDTGEFLWAKEDVKSSTPLEKNSGSFYPAVESGVKMLVLEYEGEVGTVSKIYEIKDVNLYIARNDGKFDQYTKIPKKDPSIKLSGDDEEPSDEE